MLNYIKSECYRMVRNKKIWVLLVLFLGLMLAADAILIYYNHVDPKFPYGCTEFALDNITGSMTTLIWITAFFSLMVHDSEDKQHTIKNSVAFGIDRKTIYFGRFLVQVVTAVICYLVLTGIYTGVSFAFLKHSHMHELTLLINTSLACMTCLIAGLAISHMFMMLCDTDSMSIGWSIVTLVVAPIIIHLFAKKIVFLRQVQKYIPYTALGIFGKKFRENGTYPTSATVLITMVGLAWIVAALVIGMVKFQKKEVK